MSILSPANLTAYFVSDIAGGTVQESDEDYLILKGTNHMIFPRVENQHGVGSESLFLTIRTRKYPFPFEND